MNTKLILVRHSRPEIDENFPANQWILSREGRHLCIPLVERLARHHPSRIISSIEPKAEETGRIIAKQLGLRFENCPGLEEHKRAHVPFVDEATFVNSLKRLFKHPQQRVFGDESASEAHDRFREAVERLMNSYLDENLAIVSHGTVMSLYIAHLCAIDPFPFWRRLGLPSFVVLSPCDGKILELFGSKERDL